jgi:ATP-dependent helicase/nuclease subunit A
VTALRREAEEMDEEAEHLFSNRPPMRVPKRKAGTQKLSAAQIGAAHHKFLQHVALAQTTALAAEADRLTRENYLSADERAVLDLDALAAFWNSPLGNKIIAHATDARRELPFTARFGPAELQAITGRPAEAGLEDEFVVVQGVADLVVLRPQEIWLVDFKTDDVKAGDLADKIKIYRPQLELYAAALEKIFARQVTLRALHFLTARRTAEI